MGNATYRVIFRGIAEGFSQEEVEEKLAAVFKVGPEKIKHLFKGKPVVIKKGLDRATALKYKSAFDRVGAQCAIEMLGTSTRAPSKGDVEFGGIEKESLEKSMTCPKCGFKQKPAEACVRCGIIVDKFLAMVEHEEPDAYGEAEALGTSEPTDEPTAGAGEKIRRYLGTKYGLLGTGLAALLLVFMVFETFYLRGDLVARGSVNISSTGDLLAIKISEPWKVHLVEVSTGRRNTKLNFRLEGPLGAVLYEDTEYASHKGTRTFTFKPTTDGTYNLYVDPGALTLGGWGYARVEVYVNDRRLLRRIFGAFNF
jgi:hypothetical protein